MKIEITKYLMVMFFAAAQAQAQIQVTSENEPYQPIVATLKTEVPEQAKIGGGWKASEGVQFIEVGNGTIHIWAAPGEHTLEYTGFWIHTEERKFKDGDGNEVTIPVYIGHGFVSESADFSVTGGEPEPPPDPPEPPPGETYQVVFFLEAGGLDKMTPAQRALVTGDKTRDDLAERGHYLRLTLDGDEIAIGVPAIWKPWVRSASRGTYPLVAYAPTAGGPILTAPFPSNYDALLDILEGGP